MANNLYNSYKKAAAYKVSSHKVSQSLSPKAAALQGLLIYSSLIVESDHVHSLKSIFDERNLILSFASKCIESQSLEEFTTMGLSVLRILIQEFLDPLHSPVLFRFETFNWRCKFDTLSSRKAAAFVYRRSSIWS